MIMKGIVAQVAVNIRQATDKREPLRQIGL